MIRKPAFDSLQCTLCGLAYAACAFVLAFAAAVMVSKGFWSANVVISLAGAFGAFAAVSAFTLVYLHLRAIPARY